MNSLNKELFKKNNYEHNTFLVAKAKIEEVNQIIDTINFLSEDQPEEEENEKEDA